MNQCDWVIIIVLRGSLNWRNERQVFWLLYILDTSAVRWEVWLEDLGGSVRFLMHLKGCW